MGCVATKSVSVSPSTPKNGKNRQKGNYNTTTTTTFTETETMNITGVTYQEIVSTYDFLVTNCSAFKCPPGTVPIVCLSEDSIPVVMSSLSVEQSHQTGIFLPILAANAKSTGRIACFGNITMLIRQYFNSGDTAVLIHNVFLWLNGKKPLIDPIHFVSIPKEYHSEIKGCFQPHGVRVSFDEFHSEVFEKNTFVIVPSYFNSNEEERRKELKKMITKGGGIGVIYIPKSEDNDPAIVSECEGNRHNFNLNIQMNEFLIKFGLSFTYCALSEEHSSSVTVSVHDSFETSKKFGFYSLVDQFDTFVNSNICNPTVLDDLVTTIRYHVMVSGRCQVHLINRLMELCWLYLEKTAYVLEDKTICPEVSHSIIIVLMQDLYMKQPVERIKAAADAANFPGIAADFDLIEVCVDLKLQEESLISTGLWLPPGVVGTIECYAPPNGLQVQIGAHRISLLTKPGPWKRWPMVVSAFKIRNLKTCFSSAFGGILYIAVSSLEENEKPDNEEENGKNNSKKVIGNKNNSFLKATFENVIQYPMVIYNNPSVYRRTKDLSVPWGEIVSKSIIFTLPTKYIMKMNDSFDDTFEFVEKYVTTLANYMNYPIVRPYRIVFDVETIDDKPLASNYPLVLLENDIEDVLFIRDRPTPGLFRCLMSLALVSLRDGCFDSTTENALSAFGAAEVFTKLFPFYDPIGNPMIEMPILFTELWLIHMQVNKRVIPEIITKSQSPLSPVYDVPEDRWIAFVKDICYAAKLNFSPVLEKARPIPLNVSANLDGLQSAPPLEY